MSDSNNDILSMWNEIKILVDSLELDMHKNARGVAAAGVRARKGLRDLKARVSNLVKATIEIEKSKKSPKE